MRESKMRNAPLGNMRTSTPVWAFLSIALFVSSVIVLTLTGHDSSVLIPLLVSQIPSVVAALFSERAARDIRNGVVEEKAHEGAKSALANPEAMETLAGMLEHHVNEKDTDKP